MPKKKAKKAVQTELHEIKSKKEHVVPLSKPVFGSSINSVPAPQKETEEMSEDEADAMIEEKVAEEKAVLKKLEDEMDGQYWSMADPVIPEALKGEVWVAVYKDALGHKTKATNRQAKSGVLCWTCKEAGKVSKADIMIQFLEPPDLGDPDVEKRRKARKGVE